MNSSIFLYFSYFVGDLDLSYTDVLSKRHYPPKENEK
jgi:hypothetical protein